MTAAQTILDNNTDTSKKNLKIVFFDLKDWEKKEIERLSKDFDVHLSNDPLSEKNVSEYSDADIISTFINSDLSKKILEKFNKLKFITTRSTGFDHIDVNYCNEKGIIVANVPSYGSNTVAEHAMALILALTRRIVESVDRVRKNDFSPLGLTGVDLMGKVIGVVGTGKIGQNVIKYSNAFGLKVLAYDVKQDLQLAEKLNFTYVELDYLLGKSDIISLHVPYLPSTHHLINRETINKIKSGAYLINTARGGLVETDALFDALRTGKIAGAGLDVFEEEKFLTEELVMLHTDKHEGVDFKVALENHMMANLPNVVMTPHNAFNSTEALQRIIRTTIENILSYTGGNPINTLK